MSIWRRPGGGGGYGKKGKGGEEGLEFYIAEKSQEVSKESSRRIKAVLLES